VPAGGNCCFSIFRVVAKEGMPVSEINPNAGEGARTGVQQSRTLDHALNDHLPRVAAYGDGQCDLGGFSRFMETPVSSGCFRKRTESVGMLGFRWLFHNPLAWTQKAKRRHRHRPLVQDVARPWGPGTAAAEVLEVRVLLTAVFDPASSHLEITLSASDDVKVTASPRGLVLLNAEAVDSRDGQATPLAASQVRWLTIFGGTGRNTINARQVLKAGFPNLRQVAIYGGGGSDRIFGSNSGINVQSRQRDIPNRLFGGGGNDIIHGGGANDVLIGGPGNDAMHAWFGHDFLAGGDGDDYLSGGPQNDRLFGQDGDDDIHGETGTDEVHGQAGNDIGGTGSNPPGDANPETGFGIDYAYGGPGDDHLFGFTGENRLFGGPGNDTMGGNEHNDSLYGEAGDDLLLGGDGADQIEGGPGNDRLFGDATIRGDTTAITIEDGPGSDDDILSGGDGDDRIEGQDGNDLIRGGRGDDDLIGGRGADFPTGVAGDDTIHGDLGRDRLNGLAEVPAFPGAEGYGAGSIGGRHGEVLFVTNLNDSGPGSLRAAVEATGPRTVIFRVAGVITLERSLEVAHPFLTIAGQSAPAPGITLRMNPSAVTPDDPVDAENLLTISTHDVVVRYLKFRRGDSRISGDNINIVGGASNVVVDHVSLSWSTDESVAIWTFEPLPATEATGIHNVSFQNSIIGESLQQVTSHWLDPNVEHTTEQAADLTYTDYEGDVSANVHPLGLIVGGKLGHTSWQQVRDIDIHHNLFFGNTHRNPRITARGARVINNSVYNWFTRAGSTAHSSHVDYIGNRYQHGPLSLSIDSGNGPRPHFLWHDVTDAALNRIDPEDASLFLSQNIAPEIPELADPENDNWQMLMDTWRGDHDGPAPQLDLAFRRNSPLPEAVFPVAIETPSASERLSLVSGVGATSLLGADGLFYESVDFVDARTLHGVATDVTRYTTRSRIYRTAVQAGGYERLDVQLRDAWADADQDGMADLWESRHRLDLSGQDDHDRDGYTNLEEFLNGTSPFHSDNTDALPAVHIDVDPVGRLMIVDSAGTPNRISVTQDLTAGVLVISSASVAMSFDGFTQTNRVEIPVAEVTNGVFAWLGSGDDHLDLSGLSISSTVHAGSGDDTVFGTAVADVLAGDTGNDRLRSGAGNDVLFGGSGRDVLAGGPGDDLLKGQGSSGDTLTGGPGADTLDGGAGADRIDEEFTITRNISLTRTELRTDDETDVLRSIETAVIQGGDGGVTIDTRTFTGAVILYGGAAADRLFSGAGSDQLFGMAGDDTLDSGAGNDWLLGSAGRDVLRGGNGNDNLRGQGGSGDRLIGGPGIDAMDGGAGEDIITRDGEDIVIEDTSDITIAELNVAFDSSDDWMNEL